MSASGENYHGKIFAVSEFVVSYDEAHAVTLVCVIMERKVEIDKDLLLSSKY